MAYTSYPYEAQSFKTNANNLKEKVNETDVVLTKIKVMLSEKEHRDYLSKKTLEANEKLREILKKSNTIIDNSINDVKRIADRLEKEEEEAQKKTEEGESNG